MYIISDIIYISYKRSVSVTQDKINRINELARKSRVTMLSEDELCEQKNLRDEYRTDFKKSLCGHLENITIVEPDGEKVKVKDLKKQ